MLGSRIWYPSRAARLVAQRARVASPLGGGGGGGSGGAMTCAGVAPLASVAVARAGRSPLLPMRGVKLMVPN